MKTIELNKGEEKIFLLKRQEVITYDDLYELLDVGKEMGRQEVGKLLNATQLAKILKKRNNIKYFSSTVFYDWLDSVGYGTFDFMYKTDKKRTFQYGLRFKEDYIDKGLVFEGITNNGDKTTLYFSAKFLLLLERESIEDIKEYASNYSRYIHERDYRK